MRKIIGFVTLLILLVGAGYLYLRFHVLKARDFKPVVAKEKNIIDLRPAIIAKLQQLVKDGSDGLYKLNIDKLEPDVINSKITVSTAFLDVDTNAMHSLDKAQKLPDDIFKIKIKGLQIDGLGIDNFLHKDSIVVSSIHFNEPVVNIYHQLRPYNAEERKAEKNKSLYQKILGTMRMIAINKFTITHGDITIHEKGKKENKTKLNDVAINLENIKIDSVSQFDKNRFLFAKKASFSAHNYYLPTPDSLYVFSIGSMEVSADQHTLTATNVKLIPKGGKKEFEKKLKYRKEMYDLNVPKITLKGVNWWQIINSDKWLSSQVDLFSPSIYVYLDPSIPSNPVVKLNTYPHQLLLRMSIPIAISKLNLHNLKVVYEEYNPKIKRSGIVHFDRINGEITNVTNIHSQISKNPLAVANAKGYFMNKTLASAIMKFYLNKESTGDFAVDVNVDTLTNTTINLVAEPLALFTIKKGEFLKGTAHVAGTNQTSDDNVAVEYRDLHITPLRTDSNDNGKLRKHPIESFFANKFLIKDNNPGANGELRSPSYSVDRDHHGNFFNFIWMSIMTGVLKTIGIPVKLVIKG